MVNSKSVMAVTAALIATTLVGWSCAAFADDTHIQTNIGMVNPDNDCKFQVDSAGLGKVFNFTANIADGSSSMVADPGSNDIITVTAEGGLSCGINGISITATSPSPQVTSQPAGRMLQTSNGGYFLDNLFLSTVAAYLDTTQTRQTSASVGNNYTVGSPYIFDGTETPVKTPGVFDYSTIRTGGGWTTNNFEVISTAPIYAVINTYTVSTALAGAFAIRSGRFASYPIDFPSSASPVKVVTMKMGYLTTTHPMVGYVADDSTVHDGESLSSTWTITVTPS